MSAENDSSSNDPRDHSRVGPTYPMASCVLGASLFAFATFVVASQFASAPPPTLPSVPTVVNVEVVVKPIASRDVVRAAFFDEQVEPQIAKTDQFNRAAADRCLRRLVRVIDRYRDHVDPFVKDLTSISTRFGILRRMPGGWWKEDDRVESYVQQKFEHHLFSEQSLMLDVAGVLEDFRAEVDANQKRMLVSVRASLDTDDLPEVQIEDYEIFFAAVAQQLGSYSAQQGTSSVYNAVTVLIISEAGSYAAVTIVAGLLARLGAMAATTAAAAGGATVGSTAAGAGGGSLAGPVGTVVGLGVGLAIGIAIDWWMTEQFEEEMNASMTQYLNSLQEAILHGAPLSANQVSSSQSTVDQTQISEETRQGGLAEALPVVCDQLKAAYRERFYEQIVTMESP